MDGASVSGSKERLVATPPLPEPPLPGKVDEDGLSESGSLTISGYYKTIHPSGPQLGRSPTRYLSFGAPNSGIQTPDSDQRGEGCPLVEETKVYKRRWYVLLVYSLLAASQGGIWNVYGPIAETAEDAFGWSDATIALLSNWGPIAYLLGGVVMSWMMDVKGLRLSCVISAVLLVIGAGLKCISFDTPLVTWLTHIAQFANGLAGPVAMAAPPILSAVWFPPRERTTATAIGALFNSLGVAFSFIMGPLLVPDVPRNSTNTSSTTSFLFRQNSSDAASSGPFNPYVISNDVTDLLSAAERISREKKGIALYMYIAGGWSALVLVLFLLYFPSKPPRPPCPSAAIARESFLKGLKHLLTRKQFWLVAVVYGMSTGTLGSWSSVLDVILKPHGIGETEAGWIGFYSTCGSCLGCLIVARFADFFTRILKWLIISSYFIGTAALLVFALLIVNIIPSSTALIYATVILGNTAVTATVPLIFELACELSYPTGEGITNGVLTTFNNVFALVFLFIMMVPNIGTLWTNWMIVGTSGVCLPLLFLLKEKYNRLEIDEHNPSLVAEITILPPDAAASCDGATSAMT